MIENQREDYGIESFGITLTTLEEVFLSVALGAKNESIKNNDKNEGEEEIVDDQKNEEEVEDEMELKNIRV